MISTDLANTADWLLGYAAKQQPISPKAAAHLAQVLFDMAKQARQLERLPVDDTDLVMQDDD